MNRLKHDLVRGVKIIVIYLLAVGCIVVIWFLLVRR